MKRMIYGVIILMALAVLSPIISAAAEEKPVVSLGADLNENQRKEMLNLFKVDEDSVDIITVTNAEERSYLEGVATDKQIGTRAISSAYVEILSGNEGILVETHNINWVTKEMYANAMVTAGIKNARVIAAAPFEVSGTAALTGIIKAFEKATGSQLSDEAKKTANEELVTTGELADDIGKDNAAALIKEIKERIASQKAKNPEDIRNIIINVARDLNINITNEHIDQLADLMEKISKLNLSAESISQQLEKISGNLDKVRQVIEENKGLLQQILDAIKRFFKWLADLLRR